MVGFPPRSKPLGSGHLDKVATTQPLNHLDPFGWSLLGFAPTSTQPPPKRLDLFGLICRLAPSASLSILAGGVDRSLSEPFRPKAAGPPWEFVTLGPSGLLVLMENGAEPQDIVDSPLSASKLERKKGPSEG